MFPVSNGMEILNQDSFQFIQEHPVLFTLFLLWSLVWKGLALWKSGRLTHKWWFVIILVANTLGILDMIYIFFVAKKYEVESKETK